jgi:hypothetical protein
MDRRSAARWLGFSLLRLKALQPLCDAGVELDGGLLPAEDIVQLTLGILNVSAFHEW